MCELMTIAAALVCTALYFIGKRRSRASQAMFTTMLMFWGAALMWSVDCVGNAMDGEGLFDFSREDTVLGGIVIAAGLLVFAALCLVGRLRSRAATNA